MRRFDGLLDDVVQLALDRVEVDRVPQSGGELGHGLFGVMTSPVERTVDDLLHALAQRVEQCSGGERGSRRPNREENGSISVVSATRPTKVPASSAVRIA